MFVFDLLKDKVEKQSASHRAHTIDYKTRIKASTNRKYKASEALRAKRTAGRVASKKKCSTDNAAAVSNETIVFLPAPASL
jgi:hypothetical protein